MIPKEYTIEDIKNKTTKNNMYENFLKSREPLKSILKNNPSWKFISSKSELKWGEGLYYDTTIYPKHPYWCNYNLPKETKNINQMRKDILEWGYCIIDEGLSIIQLNKIKKRIIEQMEGERREGIAQFTKSGQNIYTLINKGKCFEDCIELNTNSIQAGNIIEQLLNECLGNNYICNSFLAVGADPGCIPQFMHQDQNSCFPHKIIDAPLLFNVLFCLDNINDYNGGTLIIPGSHKISDFTKPLPSAINLHAKAGSIVLFDGRLWHGTGANRSNEIRYICALCKSLFVIKDVSKYF